MTYACSGLPPVPSRGGPRGTPPNDPVWQGERAALVRLLHDLHGAHDDGAYLELQLMTPAGLVDMIAALLDHSERSGTVDVEQPAVVPGPSRPVRAAKSYHRRKRVSRQQASVRCRSPPRRDPASRLACLCCW